MPFTSRKTNIALWIAQGALAALFLFTGVSKLAMPVETLARISPFSPIFMKFIGACEIAGALGLILPGIFHRHTELTSLAAIGLTIIMVGAVTTTVVTTGILQAALPFVAGVLTLIVARGRRPHAQRLPPPQYSSIPHQAWRGR